MIGDKVVQIALACDVSAESLPTLLRRLTEMEYADGDEGETLAADILDTLDISGY